MKMIFLLCLMFSCSTTEDVKGTDQDLTKATQMQEVVIKNMQDELDDGGRVEFLLSDCDGYLWLGKWCSVTGCNLDGHEENGRLYRREAPRCWVSGGGKNQDSKATWSRDMGICGVVPLVIMQKRHELLKRHLVYVQGNNHYSGEPTDNAEAISRVFYNPVFTSLLLDVESFVRSGKEPKFYDFYTQQNLDDYQAHLQVCKIWAKTHMRQKFTKGEGDAVKRHYKRVPKSPFYAFMYAQVTGDYKPIVDICESKEIYHGDYIRCDESEMCGVIERVFACNLLIKSQG